MSRRLSGKVAVITGTAGGQGRAAAQLFAAEGATIVGCDLNAAGAAETVKLVEEAGGTMASQHPLDLADGPAVRRWTDDAAATHGGIDILYNNASAPKFASITEMSTEDWQSTLRNELDVVFHATQAAWPHLVARRTGQPEDIARAALFLASDDASFITGANLVVDGGYTVV